MRRCFLFIFTIAVSFPSFSQGKRDLLTTSYSQSLVNEILIKNHDWVSYPAYKDRQGWEKISQPLRDKYISSGEKYIGYAWPEVKATEYLEFSRTGNRQAMETPQSQRRTALQSLVMAELMEGKGRFMDDIANGVFSFCEQSYWGMSACFYMHNRGKTSWNSELGETNLPDIDDPVIDLWVAEFAADLSWIWYFFHEEFDKISPVISKRLKNELQKRVLDPFYERNDYWWITGWGRGSVNNWTPWCNYNVLTCILLIEQDIAKKIKGVYKTMTSVDLFLNVYPDDGGCDEGPSYWGVAGGKAFDYLSLLKSASGGNIDLFDKEIVKDIGRYIYRAYICDGQYFINFADAPAKMQPRAGVIYRYGQQIHDPVMENFGIFLLSRFKYGVEPKFETLGPVLDDMFMDDNWQKKEGKEPLPPEFYFPDLQVAIARDKSGTTDGFYLVAKGGSNGEGHNHNDVGTGIVYYNCQPVLVDAGVGTYTRETFSSERYKIWTMQSTYHNLPLINGIAQNPGGRYKATNPAYKSTKSKVSFSVDIAAAYPEEAKVEQWIRSYSLERGKKISISDNYRLKEITGNTELHFLTPLTVKVIEKGTLELKGKDFRLKMKYDPAKLSPRIEEIDMKDNRLKNAWPDGLFMIVFDVVKNKSGSLSIDVFEK
jgi:hypothetical protein